MQDGAGTTLQGKLAGKVALVTGASRGIGAGIAQRLARDGATVIVNYARNRAKAEAVVADISAEGGKAFLAGADITDLMAQETMFAEISDKVGEIDILVNNAGKGSDGFPNLDQVTPDAYDAVFALNTRAVFFTIQRAARIMRDGGRIVTISSMASRIRHVGLSTYAASKAAADAFTRILAMELAPRNITINSVQSGIVGTDILAGMDPERKRQLIAMIPLGRIGRIGDIADVVAFLASDDSRWISGHELPVSGGRYV
jgi:3-oxoacyl-[acyl-carrier protein] reductase